MVNTDGLKGWCNTFNSNKKITNPPKRRMPFVKKSWLINNSNKNPFEPSSRKVLVLIAVQTILISPLWFPKRCNPLYKNIVQVFLVIALPFDWLSFYLLLNTALH